MNGRSCLKKKKLESDVDSSLFYGSASVTPVLTSGRISFHSEW